MNNPLYPDQILNLCLFPKHMWPINAFIATSQAHHWHKKAIAGPPLTWEHIALLGLLMANERMRRCDMSVYSTERNVVFFLTRLMDIGYVVKAGYYYSISLAGKTYIHTLNRKIEEAMLHQGAQSANIE